MHQFSLDLHVHTVQGSSDSSLTPAEVQREARRLGLDGVCVSEHERIWSEAELRQHTGCLEILPATEWSTDAGHVLVLGLSQRPPGLYRIAELRDHVRAAGGLMVAAHPFRYVLQPWSFRLRGVVPGGRRLSLAEACDLPLLHHVDAIEVLNGNCTDEENDLATAVAERLRLPGTAGSDAHSAATLASCVTLLPCRPAGIVDVIEAIRQRRCSVVRGFRARARAGERDGSSR